jgi:hypothetical protein
MAVDPDPFIETLKVAGLEEVRRRLARGAYNNSGQRRSRAEAWAAEEKRRISAKTTASQISIASRTADATGLAARGTIAAVIVAIIAAILANQTPTMTTKGPLIQLLASSELTAGGIETAFGLTGPLGITAAVRQLLFLSVSWIHSATCSLRCSCVSRPCRGSLRSPRAAPTGDTCRQRRPVAQ